MKLSKKDKIMLLVLAVIMVVAIFYVYVIMPKQEEVKELTAQIAQQDILVNGFNERRNKALAEKRKYELDEVYAFHYDKMKPSTMMPKLDRLTIDRMMYKIFDDYGIRGVATTGWGEPRPVSQEKTNFGVTTTVYNYVSSMSLTFKMEKKDKFRPFLDAMYDDPNFKITGYNVKDEVAKKPDSGNDGEGEKPDGPIEVVAKYELSGTMNIDFYMGDQYESNVDGLYQKMDAVMNLHMKEGTKDTIVFDKIDPKYEKVQYFLYKVDEVGNVCTYTRMLTEPFEMTDLGDKIEVKFASIPKNTKVAVCAVGGIASEKRFYKTPLDNTTENVKVTSYKDGGDVKNLKSIDYDTIEFDAMPTDLKDVVYSFHKLVLGNKNEITYVKCDAKQYTMTEYVDNNDVRKVRVKFNAPFSEMIAVGVECEDTYGDSYRTQFDIDTPIVKVDGITPSDLKVALNKVSIDTIKLNVVDNAVKYELFVRTVKTDKDGKSEVVFTPIDEFEYDIATNVVGNEIFVTFNEIAPKTDVAVRITTKDNKGVYSRTALNDKTSYITVTSVKEMELPAKYEMKAGEFDTIVLSDVIKDYKSGEYKFYIVANDGTTTIIPTSDYIINDMGDEIEVSFLSIPKGSNVAVVCEAYADNGQFYVSKMSATVNVTPFKDAGDVIGLAKVGVDTLEFNAMPDVIRYEMYKVTMDKENRIFTLIDSNNYRYVTKDDKIQVVFKTIDNDSDIAVRVVTQDASNQYFKTFFDKETPVINLSAYKDVESVSTINNVDGEVDTLVFDEDKTLYDTINYTFYIRKMENGEAVFTRISSKNYTVSVDGNKVYASFVDIPKGSDVTVVVNAKDKQGNWTRTALDKNTKCVKITPYKSIADVTSLANVPGYADTITFDSIANIVRYDIYTFTVDSNGDRQYEKLTDIAYDIVDEMGKVTIKFTKIMPRTSIVMRPITVDSSKQYYRNDLTNACPTVQVTSYEKMDGVQGLKVDANSVDTMTFTKVENATYTNVKYKLYKKNLGKFVEISSSDYVMSEKDNLVTVKFNTIDNGTNVYVLVEAIDAKYQLYRSALNDNTQSVQVTAYKVMAEPTGIVLKMGTHDTLTYNALDVKYLGAKFYLYSVTNDAGQDVFTRLDNVTYTIKDNGATLDITFVGIAPEVTHVVLQVKAHDADGNYYKSNVDSMATKVALA